MNQKRPEFPVTLVVRKAGDLVWLGHLDFGRAVGRALRRSGLKLLFSEGYHPRPSLRLPEPLPLGVGSDGERFVAALAEPVDVDTVAAALAGRFPAGLELVSVLAGSQPEPRDEPVDLVLGTDGPARLAALLATTPAAHALLPQTVEVAEDEVAGGNVVGGEVVVRLVPPPGERVSVGRFLAHAKELAATHGLAVRHARRRVALQSPSTPLQCPPPFA